MGRRAGAWAPGPPVGVPVKIRVDPDKCQGHARCYGLAPELFEVDDYLALYNQAFGKSLRAADLPAGERILERIKEKEGDFDAGRPADALLRLRDKLLPPLRPTTRARFEELFRRINKTL